MRGGRMSILIDRTTRIIVQGITGTIGRSIAGRMIEAGTAIVGGVTPGKGGETLGSLPIFDGCHEAVERTNANASFIAVPPGAVLDASLEAIDAGVRTIVIYCEGVPVVDAVRLTRFARDRGATVIGPNAAGCISPGQANLSDLADANIDAGRVGIVSKSGTLTYEVADGLRQHGLGISTLVCLGGDPVIGTDHADALRLFEADPDTDIVVLLGEIGGRSELAAADMLRTMSKPSVAFVAGRHAPAGRRMGHAGAIAASPADDWLSKTRSLAAAGAVVVERLTDVAAAVAGMQSRVRPKHA
jgi:succinyl-CoA synthetase alpha subunit